MKTVGPNHERPLPLGLIPLPVIAGDTALRHVEAAVVHDKNFGDQLAATQLQVAQGIGKRGVYPLLNQRCVAAPELAAPAPVQPGDVPGGQGGMAAVLGLDLFDHVCPFGNAGCLGAPEGDQFIGDPVSVDRTAEQQDDRQGPDPSQGDKPLCLLWFFSGLRGQHGQESAKGSG